MKKIGRGKPLQELVKGSLDYLMASIHNAFRKQFMNSSPYVWIAEIFAEWVIVREDGMAVDEYYQVGYQPGESGGFAFAERSQWDLVELSYTPSAQPAPNGAPIGESKAKRGRRLVERSGSVALVEAEGGTRRIEAVGITADVVNANGRRYPTAVLEAAVAEAATHLQESAGQGRLLLGESEHPSDKGGRPNLLETVVRWTGIRMENGMVRLDGTILETSKGRDILALMEGGVMPGVSQRAFGLSKSVKEAGRTVEEITELHITGYDLVMEPSDPNGAVIRLESVQEEDKMELEQLIALIKANPDLFRGVVEEEVRRMSDSQRKSLEEQARKTLGIGPDDDLASALQEAAAAKRTLAAQQAQAAVDAAIAEATKDLPYGEKLNAAFVEAVKGAKPTTPEAVRALVEAKRKEYDEIVASGRLAGMGMASGVQVLGPVLERERGIPEFAQAAFALTESMIAAGQAEQRDLRTPRNRNERYAKTYLERFDALYRHQLIDEARRFQEAEQTSDLSLPYSVSRAVIAEALPRLIAVSVFDFDTTDQSPTKIYYEAYSGETGVLPTVSNEDLAADLNAWVALANKRVVPGTVVVTNEAGNVTYTEGSDYVIDYANGKIMALATITDTQALKVDYTYNAVRKGEMASIERAKLTLSSQTLEMAADRLATEISREAVVFSRSQIGWDATTRTLASLVSQLARKIDQGAIYMALASVLQVASNSGGTWTAASDPVTGLIEKIGVAKVLVAKRFYAPSAILMSVTNSDRAANWDGFSAAGLRADGQLNETGMVGRIKGLPVFESTECPDGYIMVVARDLVMHRVFSPMRLRGPFPSYSSDLELIAADQYYAEEFNGTASPVPQKGASVKVA